MKSNSLFKRVIVGNRVEKVLDEVEPGNEWVLEGKGDAYEMHDGKEFIVESGTIIDPEDMEEVNLEESPLKDAFEEALYGNGVGDYEDGTYILCGPLINENSCNHPVHYFTNKINTKIDINRTYNEIKSYLKDCNCLGILFISDTGEECCITKKDFNYE